ncbi:MAG: hypothetical protein ACRDP9_28660 [Kribbellaceae bacterium]|nr:hypothetical protein [Kribbellaceae bacterium]
MTAENAGTERAVRIDGRFCGPARSGNGGYSAGLLGSELGNGPVQVTLRLPPPLDTALMIAVSNDTATLSIRNAAEPATVAEAERVDADALADALVQPVAVYRAKAAEASYKGLVHHPFPSCFACGPANLDGLRLRPGLVDPGRTACTWTPSNDLADTDGQVAAPYVWAALDCPSGWTGDLEGRPLVLGRMTTEITERPAAGETYVLVGALLSDEGRKSFTATTLYAADGRPIARARHTWIAVDPSVFE